jgi:hypothetical protein
LVGAGPKTPSRTVLSSLGLMICSLTFCQIAAWMLPHRSMFAGSFLFSFAEYPVACCGDEGEEHPP